jgi:hypothetical protein
MSGSSPRSFPILLKDAIESTHFEILEATTERSILRKRLQPQTCTTNACSTPKSYTHYSPDLFKLLLQYLGYKHNWIQQQLVYDIKNECHMNAECYITPNIQERCSKCLGCYIDIAYILDTIFVHPTRGLKKANTTEEDGMPVLVSSEDVYSIKHMLCSNRLDVLGYHHTGMDVNEKKEWKKYHSMESIRLKTLLHSIDKYKTTEIGDISKEDADRYNRLCANNPTSDVNNKLLVSLKVVYINSIMKNKHIKKFDPYDEMIKEYELYTRHKLNIGSEKRTGNLENRITEINQMKEMKEKNPSIRFLYNRYNNRYMSY